MLCEDQKQKNTNGAAEVVHFSSLHTSDKSKYVEKLPTHF